MEKIQQIINNRSIEVTPKKMFNLILIFGFVLFISGVILGYTLHSYLIYESIYNLINNNGILIFDDKYYKFVEVFPNMEYLNF